MKVLLTHNRYQAPGGEDAVFDLEGRLLTEHGHVVERWSVTNDKIQRTWEKVRTGWQVTYSQAARTEVGELISEFTPDVMHVHNFFPLLTPSIYDSCREMGVPVVQTLHNYRTICAPATLYRNQRVCEDCIGGSPYQAVLHRCYRNSALGSLAVARMIAFHRNRGTWQSKVDRFIALTEFGRAKFIEAGLPADKIVVKPNFVEDRVTVPIEGDARRGALFLGRLVPEKGIRTLLKAWSKMELDLRIIGDGPLMSEVRSAAISSVTSLGWQSRVRFSKEMARAAFLIVPSEWYEGFMMTLVEAFCHGLPVIASRLGAMAEIVEDGVTGLHFTPGDPVDLVTKVRWAEAHPKEMRQIGANARRVYEEKYTPENNYPQLMAIYEEAIEESRRARIPEMTVSSS